MLIDDKSKTYNLWLVISWIVGLRHRVHGTENLITNGPRILVVNHQSALDIPALLYVWPKRCTFVAKRSISTYASFGLLVWFMKAILIDRSNRKDSLLKLINAAKIVRDENVSVIIFPEGTRGKGLSGLLPFKQGAFRLAVKAQVPIQPIVIGPYTGFDVSKRMAKGCLCDIFVLPPIYTSDLTNDDVAALTDKVYKQMSDVYMSCRPSRF
nr:1 acyl sn glycerol 3 phosphate acyltransferase [Hymenolepis microstoma]